MKKKIDFKSFNVCISDNKFFIWNRIILETFLKSSCIQIGINHSGATMPMNKFYELMNGADIYNLVKSLHKLRQVKQKNKIKNNLLKKFSNIKKRYLDIVIDRKILSYLFHKKFLITNL